MKVGLIGAPGTHKTQVAQAISRRLNKFAGDTAAEHWVVVDGYVPKLSKQTGLDYGPRADWPANIQIMGHRWAAEADAVKNGNNAICCGTIYETATYATIFTLTQLPQAQNEAQMLAREDYIGAMIRFMSAMETSTTDYDLLFRLKLDDPDFNEWETVLDAKIPEVLEAYFRKAYILDGKTTREKADAATEAIREVQRVRSPSAADADGSSD